MIRLLRQDMTKKGIKFAILATARSGSTWLVDTIDRIDKVTCYSELFSTKRDFDDFGGGQSLETFKAYRAKHGGVRPFVTFRYLDKVFSGRETVGFKLLMTQVRKFPEVFLYLVLRRVAVIHLIRENTVDILVSKRAAWQRGKFTYKKGDPITEEVAFNYPIEKLLPELEWTERRTNQIRWILRFFRMRRIEVRYEDLVETLTAFKPVWQFLGANFENNPPRWEIQKIRKKSLRDLIINYAEVEQALKNTKYSRHLSL